MEHNRAKIFNTKLYAVITFVAVAVFLLVTVIFAFTSRYTAFHPDELARVYADGIVQNADGYNAYKNTLVSKNSKYGDFIRLNYINPVLFRDVAPDSVTEADEIKGYNHESFKGEKTLNDDGSLSGELTKKMSDVYCSLVEEYGWDDYDSIFTKYLDELVIIREEIFGDKYMSDEVFFTAFEANVSSYGKLLTGTEDVFDENTGVQLSYESEGLYEKAYGEDYKLSVNVISEEEVSLIDYAKMYDEDKFFTYGVNADDIASVRAIGIEVKNQNGEVITDAEITVVKIGMSWYVDNTTTDTSSLYNFCEK